MTVHQDATVHTAAQRMAAENVGALVGLEGHKPVGILTDRDVMVRVMRSVRREPL
jgi:CBS domain-containing protein